MKTIISICIAATVLLTSSCKTENSNGTVVVVLLYKGQTFSHASVYLKAGSLTNPNIPLQQYDQVKSVDTKGEAHFEDLSPAAYFVYASGKDETSHQSLGGEGSVSVRKRFRQNEYDISITLK